VTAKNRHGRVATSNEELNAGDVTKKESYGGKYNIIDAWIMDFAS
jgi:hypothetical protein